MRIILIYDIKEERVTKMMKLCREYLEHIQNSVFEGDITDSNLKELKMKINKIIDKSYDSVIIYHIWSTKYIKEIIGIEEKNTQFI